MQHLKASTLLPAFRISVSAFGGEESISSFSSGPPEPDPPSNIATQATNMPTPISPAQCGMGDLSKINCVLHGNLPSCDFKWLLDTIARGTFSERIIDFFFLCWEHLHLKALGLFERDDPIGVVNP